MTGMGVLLRQRARRDAGQLAAWIGGTVLLAAVGYPGVTRSYGDASERAALLATVLANPVILLFRGLPSGSGVSQLVVFLVLPWLLLLAALMSVFLAVRHTRGDEEDGRIELLAATPAGRWWPIVATLVHGVLANVLLGALVSAAFLASGAALGGSLLVGAVCAAIGAVFLGVGLVAAQLMPSARGANSLAVWAVLGTFVLAGVGNALGTPSDDLQRMASSPLTWFSPFGWAENTRAFDGDAWWPVGLLLLAAAGLAGAALVLQSGRDVGASFVHEHAGRPAAPRWFATNRALVGRLAAPAVIGWMSGGLLTGLLATALAGVVDEMGRQNPSVADVLESIGRGGGDLGLATLVAFFLMLGILAACAGVQAVVRARHDEARGAAEMVLATRQGRVGWLGAYVVTGLVAGALTLLAGVAGAALGALGAADAGEVLRRAVVAGAGQVIPVALFVGLTAVAFVALPRLTSAVGWTLVSLAAAIGLFGPLFGLSESATRMSPFAAAPTPGGTGVQLGGAWWLSLAALVAVAAALALMRTREVPTSR